MSDEKKETLRLQPTCEHGGMVLHQAGDHICVGEYSRLREGEDIRGKTVVRVNRDGSFEQLHGPPMGCSKGPAQVANDAFRDSWDRTFGKTQFGDRGGVS
jgi:hypothetical protein